MIHVNAKQTTIQVGPQKGKDRFVLMAQTYNTLSEAKVINEAALRTGLPKMVVAACWEGCGEIIKAWATEGHSCPVPGLGHMRFGIRATSVEKVEEVKTSLITSRRVIFIPSVEIKDELAKTAISITCYDKDGKKIKTVTSTDKNDIEEDDGSTTATTGDSTTGSTANGSSDSGSNTGNGGNTNTGSNTGSNTGNGGSNSGGNSGSQSGNGESGVPGNYRLVIYKYGSGTSTVTDDSEHEINTNDNVASGSNVNISIVPAAGKVPTAKINGSTNIALTENDGTYTGSFVMPTKGTVLEINSEPSDMFDTGD